MVITPYVAAYVFMNIFFKKKRYTLNAALENVRIHINATEKAGNLIDIYLKAEFLSAPHYTYMVITQSVAAYVFMNIFSKKKRYTENAVLEHVRIHINATERAGNLIDIYL